MTDSDKDSQRENDDMNYATAQAALQQYKQVGVRNTVDSASPYRVIQMLMEGALERISAAKGYIQRGDIAKKGENISMAISIISGLQTSLDHSTGSAISQNLEMLYDYMGRRLLEANIASDEAMLDEVAGLLNEIKSAWDAIPEEFQDPAFAEAAREQLGTKE